MKRAVLFLLLGACAPVGPEYVPPTLDANVPSRLPSAIGFQAAEPAGDWWRGLDDPVLARLVADALARNQDVAVAAANVRAARALLTETSGERLPDATVSAQVQRGRLSNAAQGNTATRAPVLSPVSVALGASWELDLFGRIDRRIAAARADAEAADALRADVARVIAADVALAYVDLREAQSRAGVAARNLEQLREGTRIVTTLFEAGRGTEADVISARTLELTTEANLPSFAAAERAAKNRLTTLLALAPGALDGQLDQVRGIPAMPRFVAVGDPAGLIRRRPDIRAAERDLGAATARVGVSTADLFPTVSFGASLGASANRPADLDLGPAQSFSVGPALSWNILNRGEVYARIAQSEAQAQGRLATYQKVVLTALEEADTALSSYTNEGRRLALLRQAETSSRQAADLTRVQFEAGGADFLSVLDAERTSLDRADAVAVSRAAEARNLIAVYRALAGGNAPAT